ncbi:MAG TPA: NAD(+)/NADH kinase [Candidatus Faecousia faecigallinarum]|nr:NAD(+)/NADH kinase [Candidatus Faecousia faecigallinarum]
MKKIVLTPNPYRDKQFKFVQTALRQLSGCGAELRVCLPFDVDKSIELPKHITLTPLARDLPGADMLICFGGDGTILHASKAATRADVPILGVNIGTMGFIAELESGELSLLSRIAAGEYTVERRRMLEVTVHRGGAEVQKEICLNDAVITKGAVARVVRMAVYCDDVLAMEFGGDGVIVATPTGSTAYSLSAGGPMVEPDARVMVITPICAHDIRTRPIVAADDRVVTIKLDSFGKRSAYLSVDGGRAMRLGAGDTVRVARATVETKLVRVKQRSFYEIVGSKFKNT